MATETVMYSPLLGGAAFRPPRLAAPQTPRAPQAAPEAKLLLSVLAQFRLAAQGMVTEVIRLAMEANAVQAPLAGARAAVAALGAEAAAAQEPVGALTASLGEFQAKVGELDAALAAAQGPDTLRESVMQLEGELMHLQDVLNSSVMPALGNAHAGFGNLATAADFFAGVTREVLDRIITTGTNALSGLVFPAMGFGPGGTAAAGAGGNLPGELASGAVGDLIAAGVIQFPKAGVPGLLALIGASAALSHSQKVGAQEEARRNQEIATGLARLQAMRPNEVATELARARTDLTRLETELRAAEQVGAAESSELEVKRWTPSDQPVMGERGRPSDETAKKIAGLQWQISAARVQIGAADYLNRMYSVADAAGETGGLGGTVPPVNAQYAPRASVHHPSVAASVDPLLRMRQQAFYLAGNYTDAVARGELTPANESQSATFTAMKDLYGNVATALQQPRLDPEVEHTLRGIRGTLERVAPQLNPAFRPASTEAAEAPAAAAAEGAEQALDSAVSGGGASMGEILGDLSVWEEAAFTITGFFSSAGAMAREKLGGVVASFGPLGMVATFLEGVFQGVAPLVDSLKEPLRIVGEILGAALAPILKALFPVFKVVAIAATYIGQIFFTVAGGIARAIGSVIKALGTAIDKIPFLGDFGLKSLGQGMIDTGKGFQDSARDLADARDRIKELEFGETGETLEETNEALSNLPSGFKIALARYRVAPAAPAAPVPAGAGVAYAAGTGAVAAQDNRFMMNGNVVIQDSKRNPRELWEEIKAEIRREGLRQTGSTAEYAFAL